MNMASSGYYYQSTPYYYNGNYSQPRAGGPPLSIHLCLFLATLFFLAATSLYARYESAFESLVEQLKLFLILSPLLLLLVVQYYYYCYWSGERRSVPFFIPLLAGDQGEYSYHDHRGGAGTSPWGVALVLVLVLFLISYQSSFQDWWFPLLSSR